MARSGARQIPNFGPGTLSVIFERITVAPNVDNGVYVKILLSLKAC
jgi:hypothetical protein